MSNIELVRHQGLAIPCQPLVVLIDRHFRPALPTGTRTTVTHMPAVSIAQPLLGTDIVAFVLALLAMVFASLWRRERGMGWFAISMLLLAAWSALNRVHMPTSPYLIASPWFYLMCLSGFPLAAGLAHYLALPSPWRQPLVWAAVLPLALYLLLVVLVHFSGLQIPRAWVNPLIGLSFVAMGWMPWRASRHEPGNWLALLAVAFWGLPLVLVLLAVLGFKPEALRYWGVLPVMLVAVSLLAVTLRRRRLALEREIARRVEAEAALIQLNSSLEQKVLLRTQELQELVQGLESFNRSVSHDLRGPLGGIAGLARLASEALGRGDPALAQRALPVIADQADSAQRLTEALLSLAKVGDAQVHLQAVDLQNLVQQTVAQLTLEQGPEAMPEFELGQLGQLSQVQADPELLKPVLANLIGNAVKFTRRSDRPRVEVSAETGPGSLVVHVRDNGVGFPNEAAAGLFVPFRRLHGKDFDGHGLGLSIVQRALERQGGRVWADSQPGGGAAFHFSLPN